MTEVEQIKIILGEEDHSTGCQIHVCVCVCVPQPERQQVSEFVCLISVCLPNVHHSDSE